MKMKRKLAAIKKNTAEVVTVMAWERWGVLLWHRHEITSSCTRLCCTGRDSKRMIRSELETGKERKQSFNYPSTMQWYAAFLLLRRLLCITQSAFAKFRISLFYFFVCDLLQFYCIAFVSHCERGAWMKKISFRRRRCEQQEILCCRLIKFIWNMQKKVQIKRLIEKRERKTLQMVIKIFP